MVFKNPETEKHWQTNRYKELPFTEEVFPNGFFVSFTPHCPSTLIDEITDKVRNQGTEWFKPSLYRRYSRRRIAFNTCDNSPDLAYVIKNQSLWG